MTCLPSRKPVQLNQYGCNSTFLGSLQKSHRCLARFLYLWDLWAQAGGSDRTMTKLGAWSPLISPKIQFLQLSHSLHGFGILTVVQIKLLISGRKMTKPFSQASYQKQLLWLLSKARNWISSVSLQHFWYSVGVSKISHLLTHWDIHLQLQLKPTDLQKSQKFVLVCCLWCSQMF